MLLLILLFMFLGVHFMTRTVDIDGKKIKLQIWDTESGDQTRDTPGQDRFSRTIRTSYKAYCRGAMVSWGCGEGVVRFVILELFI